MILQIVKSCGKDVPDVVATRKKKNVQENLSPKFVTYREQIDGQYWFPTYIKADDTLHFSGGSGDVHMREIIKLTNYKRFGSKTRIIFKGEAKDDPKDQRPRLRRNHNSFSVLSTKGPSFADGLCFLVSTLLGRWLGDICI